MKKNRKIVHYLGVTKKSSRRKGGTQFRLLFTVEFALQNAIYILHFAISCVIFIMQADGRPPFAGKINCFQKWR